MPCFVRPQPFALTISKEKKRATAFTDSKVMVRVLPFSSNLTCWLGKTRSWRGVIVVTELRGRERERENAREWQLAG